MNEGKNTPQVGDTAPDFALRSHNLEEIKLSSFRGKKNVVLLFFPLVGTSVCEKELCTTRDEMGHYEQLNTEVLAISVDSPFAQKLWNEKLNFNFNLLSDFNKEVSKKYNSYYEVFGPGKYDYNGVSKRSAFVIDKEGVIKYAEILESLADEPNYDAIKEILNNL